MALLIDENKGYFLVNAGFARSCESYSPGAYIAQDLQLNYLKELLSLGMVEMYLMLEDDVLKDKKIRDSSLTDSPDPKQKGSPVSPCYSVKSLWGIPK